MVNNLKPTRAYKKTVKDYECYRNFLRNVMIYNYRSRNDYAEIGLSNRSYDNYKRILLDCIDSGFITERYQGKEKILGFNADIYNSSYNFLIDTFYNKGIKKTTYLCLLLLAILSEADAPLSISELQDHLFDTKNQSLDYSDSSLRRCIDFLLNYGYIKLIKENNKFLYEIADNPLDELTEAEIQELYTLIMFYCNNSLLSVPGYFLANTMEQYMRSQRNITLTNPTIWQYRCRNYSRVVDDEIIYTILLAIKNKEILNFKYGNSNKCFKIMPEYIVTDYPYGRTYLHAEDNTVYKIEKIYNIKTEAHKRTLTKTFNDKPKQKLELLFTFSENDDPLEVADIKHKLEVEASWMEHKILDSQHYLYSAAIADALTFAPWIRTFHKFVSLTPNCEKSLTEKLLMDKKEALKNYGII